MVSQSANGKLKLSYIVSDREYSDMQRQLAKQFGAEPSDRDICWSLLNKWAVEDLRGGHVASYRSRRFEQAEILRKIDKKLDLALEMCLEVCYIDLNGPFGVSGKLWDRQFAKLAPGVVEVVVRLMRNLKLTIPETEARFLQRAEVLYKTMRLQSRPKRQLSNLGMNCGLCCSNDYYHNTRL